MANSKRTLFLKRRLRVRNKLRKINTGKPRLSVHRSSKNISVQVIDDIQGVTLASASTLEKSLGFIGKNNVDASAKVGSVIAERAKKAGVEEVLFDRGGRLFHGQVMALADAARSGGLKFLNKRRRVLCSPRCCRCHKPTDIADIGCLAPAVQEAKMAERNNQRGNRREREETPEFADRLVAINRVSKTVKGGKRFGFAALVVVGDQKGRVGFGKGKAKEVPEAIRKATEQAKRQMIRVPLREARTLHHDMEGRHGAGKVVMRSAPQGTGIIAGGPMRAVFEMLGLQDVVAKSIGSQNPYNMIRATMNGLQKESSPRMVAQRRGKKVADILNRGDAPAAAAEPAEA